MVSAILSRVVILLFGTLYPAYASYKAVKTKNVKEYVKWMMYWIVFALFCAVETFADVFLSWVPFYYEIKIIFVFWLLSPVTKGASFIYRKFVHPQLNKREKEIDEAIAQARTKGYSTMMTLGHKGLSYATNVVVNTAIKGQSTLVEQIKKSYSTNDLRVHEGRGVDNPDGDVPYIDDSDEEFGLVRADKSQEITQDIKTQDTATIKQPVKVKQPVKTKPPVKQSAFQPIKESRLRADNRELEKRDKPKQQQHRALARSKSDASEHRTRKPRPHSGLTRVEEVEHEQSMAQRETEKEQSEEETWQTQPEEIIYYSPRKPGQYTAKEVKSDPYATLPRTRSRQRPKLNQS